MHAFYWHFYIDGIIFQNDFGIVLLGNYFRKLNKFLWYGMDLWERFILWLRRLFSTQEQEQEQEVIWMHEFSDVVM